MMITVLGVNWFLDVRRASGLPVRGVISAYVWVCYGYYRWWFHFQVLCASAWVVCEFVCGRVLCAWWVDVCWERARVCGVVMRGCVGVCICFSFFVFSLFCPRV